MSERSHTVTIRGCDLLRVPATGPCTVDSARDVHTVHTVGDAIRIGTLGGAHCQPIHDVAATLVYSINSHDVVTV